MRNLEWPEPAIVVHKIQLLAAVFSAIRVIRNVLSAFFLTYWLFAMVWIWNFS
jgi:hypothetical protein